MLYLKPIIPAILQQYVLPWYGIHGVAHWARVLETGVRLAKRTGANIEIVQLFAILHDSRRVTEGIDPAHCIRGAKFAAELRGKLFDLSDDDFDLLFVACAGHMDNPIDEDPTVQTCWDADRLDLGGLGARIDPWWLGTATLESPKIMAWADRRANAQAIPTLIQREWGIRMERGKSKKAAHPERHPLGRYHPYSARVQAVRAVSSLV
jgi:uncharacterized protein